MNDKEVKLAIQSAIKNFSKETLTDQAINLFKTLGYNTERQSPFISKSYKEFKDNYGECFEEKKFNEKKALVKEWKSIDLLFQLTRDEVSDQKSLFGSGKVKWEGEDKETVIETYLFFAIELIKIDYSRSALAQITREINKIFPMPVMLLFKYGEHLTLSVINRRLHKKNEQKDVLEKVTLIKDIYIQNPHRAHIEILFDLSFEELKRLHKFTNFVELHNAWQKTLDTKELNKRFYRELSNWYFWAINCVSFPNDIGNNKDDTIFNSESIIRLLTRLIFIWFIKEKNLIPDKIFDGKEVSKLIKGFSTKDSTVYYRAILQNLFFATLNQKIEERAFATDGTFEQNKKNYGIKNLYRYSSDFAISKDEVIQLFERVPFLNGGLFDCLDSEDKNGVVMYLDGFSRNPKKQAQVPDELFFSQEKTIDLSAVYDDKRKKNETVKGLFEIFNHYKFTIIENTPIEEEVALDPELLGRVFENLLASYNPETKTTARKQTGSFYTPREIVNYMVDESLKVCLKQKLETDAGMKPEDAEVGLEFLLGYYEEEHLFNEQQTSTLINAIDNCKILDPACGSGAFPMGILHKLVHILHKLDPQNKLWEEQQIKKVDNLIKEAGNINDFAIRDKIITDLETDKKDIEESFTNNELDYGRKLYLIENCIYGVDIQPIATQISKLRFFISLIVDQKANKNKDNFGILPLPNLETKFVTANTLIELEKEKDNWLNNQEIIQLKNELKDIRHQYFSVKNRKEKLLFQKKDEDLRSKIKSILIEIQKRELTEKINNSNEILEIRHYDEMIKRFNNNQEKRKEFETKRQKLSETLYKIKKSFNSSSEKTAKQLSSWDPYDQNLSSSFFDLEWMFGVRDGFDIVIANPPYVRQEEISFKPELRKEYEIFNSVSDLYTYFYERGSKLLKKFGVLAFITSNKFLRARYGSHLRKYLQTNTTIKNIINFGSRHMFEATTNTLIFIATKEKNKKNVFDYSDSIEVPDKIKFSQNALQDREWTIEKPGIICFKSKIEEMGRPLKDWDIKINRGILTGYNEAFIIDTYTKERLYQEDFKSLEVIKPILRGRDIKRYSYEWAGLWIIFIPWHFPLHKDQTVEGSSKKAELEFQKQYPAIYKYLLQFKGSLSKRNTAETGIRYEWYALQRCAATYYPEFEKEKIIWIELTNENKFAYSDKEDYLLAGAFFMVGESLKYLLAFLNSKLCLFYFSLICNSSGMATIQWKKFALEKVPVMELNSIDQKPFIDLIDQILAITKSDDYLTNPEKKIKVKEFEKQINQLFYQLYDLTDDEIEIVEDFHKKE